MPNRIMREGWLDSLAVDSLEVNAERFFFRLCLKADDFGRYPANPQLLRSNLYPLKEEVRNTDISRWIAACEKAGLVRCYEANHVRYLEIPKYRQRLRLMHPKYPMPSAETAQTANNQQEGEMTDIRPSDDGQTSARIRNEYESETKRINDANGASTPKHNPPNGASRSSSNRSEKRLMGELRDLLGEDEMARAGGHWRVDWVRKSPSLIERGMAELSNRIKEGNPPENRGAFLEDLLKRWR